MRSTSKTLDPFFWLLLLLTAWACLAVSHVEPKTASGQNYGLDTASTGFALWQAAPRLSFGGLAEKEAAVPLVGAKGISNPIPTELARVIPGRGNFPTLGPPTRSDVFVTAMDDIAGLNAKQVAQRLTINEADTFTIIRFPTPQSGLASPVNRPDPGFIGGGRTAGDAREFVIPNGPIPAGSRIEVVGP